MGNSRGEPLLSGTGRWFGTILYLITNIRVAVDPNPEVSMPRGAEWIVILLIVILIFGVGRVSKIGEDLGRGIRSFRQGLAGEEENKDKSEETEDKS